MFSSNSRQIPHFCSKPKGCAQAKIIQSFRAWPCCPAGVSRSTSVIRPLLWSVIFVISELRQITAQISVLGLLIYSCGAHHLLNRCARSHCQRLMVHISPTWQLSLTTGPEAVFSQRCTTSSTTTTVCVCLQTRVLCLAPRVPTDHVPPERD